jgi:hypothetical protein
MKRNNKMLLMLVIAMCLLVMIIFWRTVKTDSITRDNLDQLIYSYQNTYVGDNSSVGGILYLLPLSDNVASFSLQTKSEPYAITVQYKGIDHVNESKVAQSTAYNATTIFALVTNVDEVIFETDEGLEIARYRRAEIQNRYNEDLSSYITDRAVWTKEIMTPLFEQ